MKSTTILTSVGIMLAFACQSPNSPSPAHVDTLSAVGANTIDSLGCNSMSGYAWSQIRQECVQPWEDGIMLLNVNSAAIALKSAYLLFDAEQLRAEVFMGDNHLVLPQTDNAIYSNGNFQLAKDSVGWAVSFNDKMLYRQEAL